MQKNTNNSTDLRTGRRDFFQSPVLPHIRWGGDKKIKNYRFWQEGNDAQALYLNDYFNQKLNYIHQNPVKAEFVNRAEDYRYSSAIDYAGGKGLLEVTVV